MRCNAMRITTIFFLVLCSAVSITNGATPRVDQSARWKAAVVNPKSRIALDVAVALFKRNEWRYQQIANIRPNTIPPVVIFALHLRESDNDFKTNLGQGDSLRHRTIHVPKGRIPDKEPPYSFEEAAADALFSVDKMDKKDWRTLQGTLDACTGYNGWGPELHGVPSGYVWAGTSIYGSGSARGKYVADGKWSPTAVDTQLGCAAIFLRMQARGISIPFALWPKAVLP